MTDDLGLMTIDYDPIAPAREHFDTDADHLLAVARTPKLAPIPWPPGFAPVPAHSGGSGGGPLPKCDALVVTWTAAEARALAALFTPDVALEDWVEYDHNVAAFLPKVTGFRAPFNNRGPHGSNLRYFHKLGLYWLCQIGHVKVLCFKSGLHPAYDGPDVPMRDLWLQIIAETGCKLVVTTGTAGGIGADVKLGDVVVADSVAFDWNTKYKDKPYAHDRYRCSYLAAAALKVVTADMLRPNAGRLPPELAAASGVPTLIHGGGIVTTDFFAYDDSANTHGLQGQGQACEMGDAVLGLALHGTKSAVRWHAIRNASDPQMDGTLPKHERDKEAGRIYMRYGLFTTVGSVLATWALIRSL